MNRSSKGIPASVRVGEATGHRERIRYSSGRRRDTPCDSWTGRIDSHTLRALILKGIDGALQPSAELAEAPQGLDATPGMETEPEVATCAVGLAVLD